MTIAEWLRGAIEQKKALAIAASTCRGNTTPTGEHWRWYDCEDDTLVPVHDDDGDTGLSGCYLSSVERYPYTNIKGDGTHVAFGSDDEVEIGVARFLVDNDPASVILICDAQLLVVEQYEKAVATRDNLDLLRQADVVNDLANAGYHKAADEASALRWAVVALAKGYGATGA